MGINKRYRRKINIDGVPFVWNVALDDDSSYTLLNIVSEDKSIILSVPLGTERSYIISKGRIFQGKKTRGHWERYILPIRIKDEITPAIVSSVIRWSITGNDAESLNWETESFPV